MAAGRFPVTAVVESTALQAGAPPARRVFYAANVGPVLEQAHDANGNWTTDFELESYEANRATVVFQSAEELASHDKLTTVPSPAGSADPSRAELGPLAELPAGLTVGTEVLLPFERVGLSPVQSSLRVAPGAGAVPGP